MFFKALSVTVASAIILATQAQACVHSDSLIEKILPYDEWVGSGHIYDGPDDALVEVCWNDGTYRDGSGYFHMTCNGGRWGYFDDNQQFYYGYGTAKYSWAQTCYPTFFVSGTTCDGVAFC